MLPVQLVVRSVGYRGGPLPDSFDDKSGDHPQHRWPVDGSRNEYVVGGSSAAPTGVIGNQQEGPPRHVDTLLADLASGELAAFPEDHADRLVEWLAERSRNWSLAHWQIIDEFERAAGEPHGRPRVKAAEPAKLLHVSHG